MSFQKPLQENANQNKIPLFPTPEEGDFSSLYTKTKLSGWQKHSYCMVKAKLLHRKSIAITPLKHGFSQQKHSFFHLSDPFSRG